MNTFYLSVRSYSRRGEDGVKSVVGSLGEGTLFWPALSFTLLPRVLDNLVQDPSNNETQS